MAQILIRVDEDVAREVRRIAGEKYGGRRGALSMVVEAALRQAVSPPAEISASTLLDVIDQVSRASKDGRSKEQILANVFIMIDREFEQGIIRGMDDRKAHRARVTPRGDDPVEFLRKLASHQPLTWRVGYTDEFFARFRKLNHGQRRLVENSIRNLISADDPTSLAHHLERRAYFCNWSHRVRANLVVVFRVSTRTLTFISTGTHSQAYRPTA